MAQLNLYIPDELEEKIREKAQKEGKSISAFVADLVNENISPTEWTKDFVATFGAWEGEFPEIIALPMEKRERIE